MFKIHFTSFWSLLLLVAGMGWNAPTLKAQAVTFSYIFDGLVLTGTSTQTGATANPATYGAGLGAKTFFVGNPGDAMAGDGFTSGTPLNTANNEYFEFSLTTSACTTIVLTNFSFQARRSGTGPQNLEMRASIDGYTAALYAGTIATVNTFEGEGAAIANLTIPAGQTLSFRIYGYNASGGTGTLRIDNVTFSGTLAGAYPTAFSVTGGGAVCPPAGAVVGLSGSQANVNYQLKLGGVNQGATVPGTGNAINFGTQTGLGTYTVVATNANGCSTTQNGSVSITQSPNCGGGCTLALNATSVNVLCNGGSNGSIDLTPSGGTAPFTYAWTGGAMTQDISNLVAGTYTVVVTDASSCSKTTSVTITQPSAIVLSTTQVNVLCNGNSTGSIDLTPNGGVAPYTYDWSNDGEETPDNDTQDLSNLPAGTYTVTVTASNGCSATNSVVISQSAALLALNLSSVTPSNCFVADGSIDLTVSGGVADYTYDWSNDGAETPDNDLQDLSNLQEGTFTVTVTDANGCTATQAATLDYIDVIAPAITCPSNLSIIADGNCSGTFGSYTPATLSDNCTANPTVVQSPASGTTLNGANTTQLVTLTANDDANNAKSCAFTVTLLDQSKPSIICPGNQTVNADAICSGTVGAWSAVSASDNCGGSVTVTQSPVSGTTLNGHNDFRTITLTATDVSNNTQTCAFTVTLKDVTIPSITCPANATINANANCSAEIGSYLPSAVSDNCTANPAVTQSPIASTTISGHGTDAKVTLTATDDAGNTKSCKFAVFLKDVTPPVIVCQAFTANLDAGGFVSIVPANVFQSGTDNCGIANLQSVTPSSFTCSQLGPNSVTLTANDGHDNTSTCTAIVTVKDPILPVAKCKDTQANLDVNGTITVMPASVNNGTSDNCSFTLTLTPNTFNCSNIGPNAVELRATDADGNTATCSAVVTVKDLTGPSAKCNNPIVYLDDLGHGALDVNQVDNGSSDACGISSMSITKRDYGCGELTGINTVRLNLTDVNGNLSSCLASVSVKDLLAPSAYCADVTVQLAANGFAVVYGQQLASESFDNCSVTSYSPVSQVYKTANIGVNTLTITVRDFSGNPATCVSVVTVEPYAGSKPFQQNGDPMIYGPASKDYAFNVYPNPTTGDITIAYELPAEQSTLVRVFDLQGRLVFSQSAIAFEGENTMPLHLEGIVPGMYIVDFQSGNLKVQTKLMVKE